jgi:DNA-binding transcriptional LysR family regulator
MHGAAIPAQTARVFAAAAQAARRGGPSGKTFFLCQEALFPRILTLNRRKHAPIFTKDGAVMNLNMTFLTSFLTVASTGSFTGAAHKLHLTQPAISQHIQALEEEFGVRLFIRKGRGVSLTDEGRILLHRAQEIQNIAREISADLHERNELRQGKIRLAVTEVIVYLLPSVVHEFKTRYPGVSVELRCDTSPAAVRMVADGKADCAIARLQPLPSSTLSSQLVHVDRLVLAAPYGHPLAVRNEILAAKDMDDCILALREPGAFSREYALAWVKKLKAPVSTVETNTMGGLRELALYGCFAFLPQGVVRRDFENRRLAPLPFASSEVNMEYHLYTHKNVPTSKSVAAFLGCLAHSAYFSHGESLQRFAKHSATD